MEKTRKVLADFCLFRSGKERISNWGKYIKQVVQVKLLRAFVPPPEGIFLPGLRR